MLSYSRRRDLSLLYLIKQWKDKKKKNKRFDIFISFEIQIKNQNKQNEKINRRNENNIRAFNYISFRKSIEIILTVIHHNRFKI